MDDVTILRRYFHLELLILEDNPSKDPNCDCVLDPYGEVMRNADLCDNCDPVRKYFYSELPDDFDLNNVICGYYENKRVVEKKLSMKEKMENKLTEYQSPKYKGPEYQGP